MATGREIPGRLDATVKFAFSGRFVDWKGIQYLLPAFAKAVGGTSMQAGPDRGR
jgi:hypothetical protein